MAANAKTAALEALIEAHAGELKLPTVKARFRGMAEEATHDQQTPIAYLAALAVVLGRGARRLHHEAGGYRLGALSEERVGALLEGLPAGWLVEHDVEKRGGGDIDHVAHSPGATTFLVDTKRSRWRGEDIAQAHRHVEWAARHYGRRRAIVPVICVQRSRRGPETIGGVQVVGATYLVAYLREHG